MEGRDGYFVGRGRLDRHVSPSLSVRNHSKHPKKHPSVRFLVKRTLLSAASCAGLTSRITKSLIKLNGHGLMRKANLRGGSSLSGDNHTDTSRGDENAQPSRKPWVLGVEFSDSKHDCTTSVTVRG